MLSHFIINVCIIPTCERQKNRLTYDDSITLRALINRYVLDASALCSFLFKNSCNHTESGKICLLKTGNKTANINVKKL